MKFLWKCVLLQAIIINAYHMNCMFIIGAIPDGLAIDYVSRLLYYTDAGRHIIAAMTLNGAYHATIISTRLHNPRAIELDPRNG